MRRVLFAIASLVSFSLLGLSAQAASELDNEKTITTEQIELARNLPRTLVLRVKEGSKQAEVLHVNEKLTDNAATKKQLATATFIKLDSNGKMVGELDRDSSSSSWYFWCGYNNWYYPNYYYWGYRYNYSMYYGYYYGGYNYYYYGWPYYW